MARTIPNPGRVTDDRPSPSCPPRLVAARPDPPGGAEERFVLAGLDSSGHIGQTPTDNSRAMYLSVVVSLVVHLLAIGGFLIRWNTSPPPDAPGPAAMVVELSVVPASPPIPPSKVPPGPQQVEASQQDTPKPVDRVKTDPPPEVAAALKPDFVLPPKQEVKRVDAKVPAKEAPQTTAPESLPAPPQNKLAAPVEGSNAAPPSDAQQGWLSQVIGKMARNKRYPPQAERAGQEDVVYVRLVLDRKGRLVDAALRKAGKYEALDEETLALARRASPYPAPPADMPGDQVKITVPVSYFVRRR